MSMYARVVLSFCAIALLAGCATQASAPGARGEVPVHVARVRYIEVGWGDRDYYPAPRFNLWYGFKALHVSRLGFERLLA